MDGKVIIDLTDDSSDDAPSIPCKYCNRKFATRQDFIAHQMAHKVEQAIAKNNNKKNLSVIHKRKKNVLDASQIHRALIGACKPCMESTSFGARVSSVIEQTYLLRFKQLATLRRGSSSKTCVVEHGVKVGDGIRVLGLFR